MHEKKKSEVPKLCSPEFSKLLIMVKLQQWVQIFTILWQYVTVDHNNLNIKPQYTGLENGNIRLLV